MALLDLSLVTKAIIRMMREYVKSSPDWPDTLGAPPISPLPPDKLTSDGLGSYLYHLNEEAQHKNLPAPAGNSPPVRYSPLALNLYYLLSAQNTTDDEDRYYQAQQLFGLAVKALHDFPVLTDATRINEVEILKEEKLAGSDNRIRLSLQPVPHNEAVSFWTAGSSPLRLSAYYQASVILLEPEEPPTRAGRVLTYGVYPFVGGAPRLTGSENVLRFDIPDATETQQVKLRPAEVPVGSRVLFTGIDLAGDEIHLLLKSHHWREPRQADESWDMSTTSSQVRVTVQEAASGEAVLPGIHSAAAQVVRHRATPEAGIGHFRHTSNEIPFTITPRIDEITASANGMREVSGYVFQHEDLAQDSVRVYLGAVGLRRANNAHLDPFEFQVNSASNLRLRLPEGLPSGSWQPLRVVINGDESPPRWIQAS